MKIIIEPIITEKMTTIGEKLSSYGFIVNKNANKLQIKAAVEELYGIKVNSVNTMNYTGKNKSRNTKTGFISGRTKAYKKAVVKLEKGETIDFYSNI